MRWRRGSSCRSNTIKRQKTGFQNKTYRAHPKPGGSTTVAEERVNANGGEKQHFMANLNISKTPQMVIRILNKEVLTRDQDFGTLSPFNTSCDSYISVGYFQ